MDINDEREVNVELTKVKFNELCNEIFSKSMELVDKGLKTARISSEQLDHVVILNFMSNNQIKSSSLQILVGGSTRIPKIQELLSHKFGQTRLRYDTNPEEAVAHGAAIIADIIQVCEIVEFSKVN